MKKTPAIEEAFKPLRRLEHLAKEKHDASENEHAAEHVAFEARRKALKAQMDKVAREGGNMDEIKAEYASWGENARRRSSSIFRPPMRSCLFGVAVPEQMLHALELFCHPLAELRPFGL